MSVECDYTLWILGDKAKNVVPDLVADGWQVDLESEMGVKLSASGRGLLKKPPYFPLYPCLVVVLLYGMEYSHGLHVERAGHYINNYWPVESEGSEFYEEAYDPEDREEPDYDGYRESNILSEIIYNQGAEDFLIRSPIVYRSI